MIGKQQIDVKKPLDWRLIARVDGLGAYWKEPALRGQRIDIPKISFSRPSRKPSTS